MAETRRKAAWGHRWRGSKRRCPPGRSLFGRLQPPRGHVQPLLPGWRRLGLVAHPHSDGAGQRGWVDPGRGGGGERRSACARLDHSCGGGRCQKVCVGVDRRRGDQTGGGQQRERKGCWGRGRPSEPFHSTAYLTTYRVEVWQRVITESTIRKRNKKRPTYGLGCPAAARRQAKAPALCISIGYVRDAKGGWSLTPSHAPLDSRRVAGRLTDTPCTVQYGGARAPLLSASTDTLVTSGLEKRGPPPLARHPRCPVWALTVWRPGPSRGHATYACLTQARGRALEQTERSDATSA